MRSIPIAVLVLLLTACASAPPDDRAGGVDLHVTPQEVVAGGEVMLRLVNDGPVALLYNLCTSSLERSAGEAWEEVPSDRVCTMELRTLEPGDEAGFPIELPADLAPGHYRFRTRVEAGDTGGAERIASAPFGVRD